MKWEYLFDDDILARGKRYLRDGRVGTVWQSGSEYKGTVQGSRRYSVSAHFLDNGNLERVGCSCPYAHKGHFCKHMAALLYAIDAGMVQEETETGASDGSTIWKNSRILESELTGIEEMFSDRYYFFDYPAMIRKLRLRQAVWNQGKALAKSGAVRWKSFQILGSHDQTVLTKGEVSAWAVGEIVREHQAAQVEVVFSQNEITRMTCGNWSCPESYFALSNSDRICEHEAALLYLLGEYIREHNPGDATDETGELFLRGIENLRTGPEESDLHLELTGGTRQKPLILEPFFRGEPAGDAPLLGFGIGESKTYKIKNLSEFASAMEQGIAFPFGTKTTLILGEDRLAPESGPLWKLIRSAADELREARRLGVSGNISPDLGETIPLYGERFDRFFEIMNGKSVEMRISQGRKRMLRLRDAGLTVRIDITGNVGGNGVFHGLRVEGALPQIYRGLEHAYYFDEDHLNRIAGEEIREMEPLLRIADGGVIHFRIGRKNLSSFMYDTLPWLEKHAEVQFPDRETAERCVPPKAFFAFYLDADGKSAVCTARVRYGEKEYPLEGIPCEADAVSVWDPDSIRDPDREQIIIGLLRQYFPEMTEDGAQYSTGKKEEFVYLLLEEGVERLIAAGEVSSTEEFRRLAIRRKTTFTVGVSLQSNLLTMHVQGDELSSDELIEVLAHYDRKKKFYRLKSGDFVNLDQENIAELEKMMESLHLSPREFVDGKMNIPAYRTLYLDRMLENVEGLYADRDRRFKTLVKEFKTISDADFEVPQAMKGVLRKYQKTGYRWMRTLAQYGFGGILADEMGLGKTLQTIALIEAKREENMSGSSGNPAPVTALIVTPASLVYNWGEELEKFAPKLRVRLITGNQAERAEKIRSAEDYDVLVTSYDLLKRDAAEYEGIEFEYEVIDEAQYIKNHTTAAAKAVKLIHSRSRFALTGTPIENRLSELWSIFDYLMPGFLFRYEDFRRQIELPVVKEEDNAVSEHLSRMVSPFILRRFKKDVLTDLPEKLEEVRYSVMSGEQKKLYDAQTAHMRSILRTSDSKEEFNRNRMQILAELLRLREICCDPGMYLENYRGGSVKREACMDLIRSAIDGEHRILVFSQFTTMIELLEESLREEKISYYRLDGHTPSEERLRLVNRFNAGDVPVFLISLGAGGTGLNLTGADVVIHYDPWWNLAREDQATGRAHRIGQKRKVTVYKMIVKGTVEEKILEMQEAKKRLAEDILGAEGTGSASLTREDLLELLQE